MMNRSLQLVCLLIGWVLMPIPRSYGVEILDADPELTVRLSTSRPMTDEHFGSSYFFRYQFYNHLLGTIYYEASREAVMVFGFRLTDDFLAEWKTQERAHFLFNVIKFHEGDARHICPIVVQRLSPAGSATEAAALPPLAEMGSILPNELEENRLYSYGLEFDASLKPGDIVWIGLDPTNPLGPENHNLIIAGDLNAYPGGSPPMLIVGTPQAASQTVHGISLLQSLNRLFYAPANPDEITERESIVPQWINPFRTAQKLDTLEGFRQVLEQELSKIPKRPVRVPECYKGFHSSIKPENEGWELRFPVNRRVTSIALYPAVHQNGKQINAYAFPKRFIITAIPSR